MAQGAKQRDKEISILAKYEPNTAITKPYKAYRKMYLNLYILLGIKKKKT